MIDIYIAIGITMGSAFLAVHILLICEKINVLRAEDKRDQEAHEQRMKSGIYSSR